MKNVFISPIRPRYQRISLRCAVAREPLPVFKVVEEAWQWFDKPRNSYQQWWWISFQIWLFWDILGYWRNYSMIVKNCKESFNWKHLQTNQSRIGKRVAFYIDGKWWALLPLFGMTWLESYPALECCSWSRLLSAYFGPFGLVEWIEVPFLTTANHVIECNWSITYVRPFLPTTFILVSQRQILESRRVDVLREHVGGTWYGGNPLHLRRGSPSFCAGVYIPIIRIPVIFKVGWI